MEYIFPNIKSVVAYSTSAGIFRISFSSAVSNQALGIVSINSGGF